MAMEYLSRRSRVLCLSIAPFIAPFIALPALVAGGSAPARAETFRVAPGPLGEVITQIGRQAGATIVLADPQVAGRPSPGVSGTLPLRAALRQALRGTGAEAVFITPSVIRIRVETGKGEPRQVRRTALVPAPVGADILVTASKQGLALDTYPGSAKVIRLDESGFASQAGEGSAAITRLSPALGATNLGRGRNKLFIRGIADSSFSGPTQTTTGQYLGDVRLTYNAPDPDLNLYDMERIEVLAGPQGTLYGPSSLGGILRLEPNRPSVQALSLSASTGLGFTRHGGASFEGAVMANVPVDADKALRVVLFGGRAGGYIDAPQQGRRNVNATVNYGQRTTLRFEDLGGWTIDLGTVFQNFRSGDGQYLLRGEPALTRSGTVPQPYENNYRLAFVTATRRFGAVDLTSVTSAVRQDLSTVFDATGYDGSDNAYRLGEDQTVTLISQEMRISGGRGAAPWVAGFALARSTNRRDLSIGTPTDWTDSAGLQDDQLETAVFAQASRPLLANLTATAGLRLTTSHSKRRAFHIDVEGLAGRTGNTRRLSGTLGLVWKPFPQASLFADFRQGYRPGGLGFAVSGNTVQTRQYAPDDLRMIEWGLRWGASGPVQLQATMFLVDWRNIQADLVGPYAIPYTTNIGRGVIHGLDTEIVVRPLASLTFKASGFFNRSRLRNASVTVFDEAEGGTAYALPNVPRRGARLSSAWEQAVGRDARFRLDAALRYVGPSRLGVGSYLDIPQGDYLVCDFSAGVERRGLGLSLDVYNLLDSRGNTFSYGNPVGVGQGNQWTPLRPRTVKITARAAF
ncbi:TonB-dependent receptor [Novosphingobium sp. TCA1]|uniref:TonB-dependent receptor plug domain-containing protein n=1 Tax=Novosphingobium sp. TCA1 TaxID=2682474 RepID=UPI001307E630|nr:TonB-dependent receptor [Novosphingobium sp. TCA1]GFE76005.1 TonB-dependent receptor [Novosphingobium sp. TCA1]